MEIQSEKLDEQILRNEEEMRKLQDRNNKLRKKQQEQEKKEHEKWLGLLDKVLVREYGARYPKLLEPEDILKAYKSLSESQMISAETKGVEDIYEDNDKDEYRGEG